MGSNPTCSSDRESSNGKTVVFGATYLGSNPSSRINQQNIKEGQLKPYGYNGHSSTEYCVHWSHATLRTRQIMHGRSKSTCHRSVDKKRTRRIFKKLERLKQKRYLLNYAKDYGVDKNYNFFRDSVDALNNKR